MDKALKIELVELTTKLEELMKLYEASAQDIYNKFFAQKLTAEEYFSLISMDPTANVGEELSTSTKGKYSDWLVKQFIGQSKNSDFLTDTTIKDGLLAISKLMNNKDGQAQITDTLDPPPKNLKDINSYTLDMIKKVAPLASEDQLGKKKDQQIEVVFNDKNLFVCHPLTHEAARKFGTGTKWCTATSNPSWFESYHKNGGLYIIIDKNNPKNKWQFCNNRQGDFANVQDIMISVGGWYRTQIKNEKNDWDESVDQLAQVFEKNVGAPIWSLDSLHRVLGGRAIQQMSSIVKEIAALPEKERSYHLIDGEYPLDVYVFFFLEPVEALPLVEAAVEKFKIKPTVYGAMIFFTKIHKAPKPQAEKLLNFMNYAVGHDPKIIAEVAERIGGKIPVRQLTSNMEILRYFILACSSMNLSSKANFVKGGAQSILTSDKLFRLLRSERDADSALKTIIAEFLRDDLPSQEAIQEAARNIRKPAERKDLLKGIFDKTEVGADSDLVTIVEHLKQAYTPIKSGIPKTFKMLETMDFHEEEDYETIEASEVEPLKVVLPRELAKAILGEPHDFSLIQSAAQIEGKSTKYSSLTIPDLMQAITTPMQKILIKILAARPELVEVFSTKLEFIVSRLGVFNARLTPEKHGALLYSIVFMFKEWADSSAQALVKALQPARSQVQEFFRENFAKIVSAIGEGAKNGIAQRKEEIQTLFKGFSMLDAKELEDLIGRYDYNYLFTKKLTDIDKRGSDPSASVLKVDVDPTTGISFKQTLSSITRFRALTSFRDLFGVGELTVPVMDVFSSDMLKDIEKFDNDLQAAITDVIEGKIDPSTLANSVRRGDRDIQIEAPLSYWITVGRSSYEHNFSLHKLNNFTAAAVKRLSYDLEVDKYTSYNI